MTASFCHLDCAVRLLAAKSSIPSLHSAIDLAPASARAEADWLLVAFQKTRLAASLTCCAKLNDAFEPGSDPRIDANPVPDLPRAFLTAIREGGPIQLKTIRQPRRARKRTRSRFRSCVRAEDSARSDPCVRAALRQVSGTTSTWQADAHAAETGVTGRRFGVKLSAPSLAQPGCRQSSPVFGHHLRYTMQSPGIAGRTPIALFLRGVIVVDDRSTDETLA